MNKKIYYSDIYAVFFGILTFLTTLKNSYIRFLLPIDQSVTITKLLIILMAIPIIFTIKFSIKQFVVVTLIAISIFMSVLFSNEMNLGLLFSSILACKVINYRKIIFSGLLGITFSTIIILSFRFLNLIPNIQTHRIDGTIRNGLGFILPIYLPNILTALIIYSGYLYAKRIGFYYCLMIIPTYIVYLICDSRGAFIRSILAILFFIFFVRKNNSYKKSKTISSILYYINLGLLFIGIAFSFFMAIMYDSNNIVMNKISEFMTSRPFWWHKFWELYSSKLFGQELLRVSSTNTSGGTGTMMILDSSYLSLWLENGIIPFSIFVISIFKLLGILKKNNDFESLFLWSIYLLMAITATGAIRLETNLMLLQLCFLYATSKEKEKKYLDEQSNKKMISKSIDFNYKNLEMKVGKE